MSITKTTTDVNTLKINYLSEAMYQDALANNQINENELYMTPSAVATDIPTASAIAKFDSSAHMNSTDMSSTEVSNFVDGLSGIRRLTYSYCYANSITATTISAVTTDTKVPITALYMGAGFEYNDTNKGITCLENGVYMVSASISFTTATSADLMGISIYVNNSLVVGPEYARVGGTYDPVRLAPSPIVLEAGDVITVYIRNNTSGRGVTGTGMRLSLWKLG